MNDNVNKPVHYGLPGLDIEAIDVIRSVLGPERFQGFCRGNVIKYVVRAERKNGTEDLKKAMKYLQWEIESKEQDDEYSYEERKNFLDEFNGPHTSEEEHRVAAAAELFGNEVK